MVSTTVLCCTPVLGVLIVAVVLLLGGFRRRDKKLFFIGLSALGVLTLMGGVFVIMSGVVEGGSRSDYGMLASGVVLGAGIIMFALGVTGFVRPSVLWPDKTRYSSTDREKLL